MFLTVLFMWTVFQVVLGDTDNATTCASGFRYSDRSDPINITTSCNEKTPCFSKCCPPNQILVSNTSDVLCVDNTNLTLTYKSSNLTNLDDYSEIEFYKSNINQNIVKSEKQMEQFTQIYSDDFQDNNCFIDLKPVFEPPNYKIYLLENGSSVVRHLNSFNQWLFKFPPGDFCVDRQVELTRGTVSKPELVIRMSLYSNESGPPFVKSAIISAGWLVSCAFLAVVLAVYSLLPPLRNMAGIILMAYVATLITAFMLRTVVVILNEYDVVTKTSCIWLGMMSNYTLLASFTWLNVMSFDIWWSMRGFRKMRRLHRRGVLVKLGWYGLYGWGAPVLLVIFTVVVENLDLTHMPNFIKSHYSDEQQSFIREEMLFYLDMPILITVCVNVTLFLMTVYNIWRIKRGVAQHSAGDSRRNKKDETRFGIYLKLSLVMGINWILEVVSNFCDNTSVWFYASDVFNSLTGLFIFIIFICKRSIIVQLCNRLSIGEELVRKWQLADSKGTESTKTNSRYSRKNRMDSVTDASDI